MTFLDLKTTNRGNVLVSQSLQDLFKVKTTGLFLQFCSLVFWKYLNRTHICVRKLKLGVDNRFRQVVNPFNPLFWTIHVFGSLYIIWSSLWIWIQKCCRCFLLAALKSFFLSLSGFCSGNNWNNEVLKRNICDACLLVLFTTVWPLWEEDLSQGTSLYNEFNHFWKMWR